MSYEVTVLMPVYNASKYLKEAVQSVLNQTFTNFEFLIIDDGSTDNSSEIIESFKDDRIRLIPHEINKGITATLNEGIAVAGCELIARMDADDICLPERLKLQYDYCISNPETALLSASARVMSNDGEQLHIRDFDKYYNAYNINFICPIFHPTVMFRKSIIEKLGGYQVPFSEDMELWWRLSRKYKMDHLATVLLNYRVSETSLSHVSKKDEYENAQRQLVSQHIASYMGNSFSLTHDEIECLRHEFEPFLQAQNVAGIVRCLKKLDVINERIINTTNPNYTPADITPHAAYKREFILYYYYARLPKFKAFWLLLQTKSLKLVFARASKLITKK